PLRADLEQIRTSGERAAALTQQLLAFSRRQVLQPEVLDLNELLQKLDSMLRRLIGADVAVDLHLAPDLGRVKADPGQIEQVLMNLAVNSSEAMPKGGRLVVETANAELGTYYAEGHASVVPGRYVLLAVTDSGAGMTREIQARVFEP